MADWVVILLVCGGYLLLTLVTGLASRGAASQSVAGYVTGDRALGTLVLYFVMGASVFSSFAFLGAPGWAYARGAAAFYILAYGVVGMVPLYFLGPRARAVGVRFGFVTQAELLAHRFQSRTLGLVLALLSVAVFVPYLVLQMKGAGYLLATVSGGRVPEWLGAAVTYGVVMAYVLTSGMMGIGWTNLFQGLFMLAVAWFLGLYLPYALHGGVGAMFAEIAASDARRPLLEAPGLGPDGAPWSWGAYSSAVFVSAVGFSMWPHLFMKSYTARSARALRKTVALYPTFQLFLVPLLLVGFAGVTAFPDVAPADTIVPHILMRADLPVLVVGLVCAGTLAASMSSGDAILHAAAATGLRDGVRPFVPLTDRAERRAMQALVVLVGAVAYYFAVLSEASIVALLLGAYGGVAQIFPLVFAAFYWPRATRAGALAGLAAGIGVNVLFLAVPALKPWPVHEGVYGLAANVTLLVAVSLATQPFSRAHLAAYAPALRAQEEVERPGI